MDTAWILYDVVGLGLGGLWLWRTASAQGAVSRDLIRVGVLALSLFFGAVILASAQGAFALLRGLCHGMFCVGAPLLLVVAVQRWREQRAKALFLVALAVGMDLAYLYARRVEPFDLEITRRTVTAPELAGLEKPIRVAVIADLQTDEWGDHERGIFEAVRAEGPDLVLMLGDYLQMETDTQEFHACRAALRAELATLSPRLGMFAVSGDAETAFDATDAGDNWHRVLFAGTAVQNAVRGRFELASSVPIQLLGLPPSLARTRYAASVARAIHEHPGFSIVIGHAPDFMNPVVRDGARPAALLLGGHTHGGQIVIPGFGPPITLSSVPRWLAAGDLRRYGESTWVGVCRGLGMERLEAPRIRLFCRPELMILELAAPTASGR